jgi:hypothetical protein
VARIALEGAADDPRQGLVRRRSQPQRLVDEVRTVGQQLLDATEVVLAEDEQHLDRQRSADQADEQVHHALLEILRAGLLEERHELLELVEDEQRTAVLARRLDVLRERLRGAHRARRSAVVPDEHRQRRGPVVARRDRLEHELLPAPRLHAQTLGEYAALDHLRDQPGVHERRLAGARVAVQHHAAVDGDELAEPARLRLAHAEDRVVGVAERMDPAKWRRRHCRDASLQERYGSNSLPTVCR